MTQQELNVAIAKATGEELSEIQRHGFSLVDPSNTDFDPEPNDLPPQVIDWESDHDDTVSFFQITQSTEIYEQLAN